MQPDTDASQEHDPLTKASLSVIRRSEILRHQSLELHEALAHLHSLSDELCQPVQAGTEGKAVDRADTAEGTGNVVPSIPRSVVKLWSVHGSFGHPLGSETLLYREEG